MDTIICDELLQEIFQRLPSPSSSAVSKWWLCLHRSSQALLSLHSPHNCTLPLSLLPLSLPFPLLPLSPPPPFLAASVGLFRSPSPLRRLVLSQSQTLRLCTGPISLFPLLFLSTSCPRLTSLSISLSTPLSLHWLALLHSLKGLSVVLAGEFISDRFDSCFQHADAELKLETLGLTGIRQGDFGFDWIWKNCKKLKKVQLRSCEGIGDDASPSSFVNCLKGIEEVELRTCRTIVDDILLKLAENCTSEVSIGL